MMKINEVIRKYRKEQNLTQEQIANYLGVTAPAVNKWENGMSYPDITLLAPLARILRIDVDTLLSFHEELTDKEIDQFVCDISAEMKVSGYEKVFEKASALLKEYPNCNKLILFIAQILNAYLAIDDVENKEKYEIQIAGWYEIAASCKEQELANMAVASLCQTYMAKKNYEKAQQLLDRIPPLGYDKCLMQAILFANQGKNEKAYEEYERMLYKAANKICSILHCISHLLCKEKDYEHASKYAELGRKTAELFDLGSCTANVSQMCIAIEKQDKEESMRLLEQMVDGICEIDEVKQSSLYSHMKFNENGSSIEPKSMIRRAWEKDTELDFIRNEPGFQKILNRLNG